MSLKKLEDLLETFAACENWDLKLLHFQEDKRNHRMVYQSRPIELAPDDALTGLLGDIAKEYLEKPNRRLRQYNCVEKYNGDVVATTIYTLDAKNELIKVAYEAFLDCLAAPDEVTRVFDFKTNAYLLTGECKADDKNISVKLITIQNPVKRLKHKFLYDDGVFCKADTKVLDLRLYFDIIVIGDKLYFMNMAGEKLFGMERAYQAKSRVLADTFAKQDCFFDGENLKKVATSGHYPRMLLNYQESKLAYLNEADNRARIAEKFQVGQKPDGTLDMSTDENARRLLRYLCNKGMLDPVDDVPMEVAAAKRWS